MKFSNAGCRWVSYHDSWLRTLHTPSVTSVGWPATTLISEGISLCRQFPYILLWLSNVIILILPVAKHAHRANTVDWWIVLMHKEAWDMHMQRAGYVADASHLQSILILTFSQFLHTSGQKLFPNIYVTSEICAFFWECFGISIPKHSQKSVHISLSVRIFTDEPPFNRCRSSFDYLIFRCPLMSRAGVNPYEHSLSFAGPQT